MTARAGQSCASFPDGRGGSELVHLQTGTKKTADGETMLVDVRFTTDSPGCTATVHGTAKKS